jgi:putative transposase
VHFIPNHIYHVYNQGNNQQEVFHSADDYLCFLNLTKNYLLITTDILYYCLMPNHFHFQLATDERCNVQIRQGNLLIDPVTNAIRKLLSSYARIYNKKYSRTGSVFRQKTKAKELSSEKESSVRLSDYYLNCFHYIHQNPLKAGLVKKLEDWEYSSFNESAGKKAPWIINSLKATEICGYNPKHFLKESYQLVESF